MSIFRRLRTIGRYAWRGCKWLALIAIVGFVVYVVWTNHRGQAAAERVLRELEARGVPDAQPKPDLPDEQNAARYYVAAGELLHVPPALAGQVPMVTNVRWPKFGEGMTEQQAAVLTEVINANATAFALLRQAEGDEPFRLDTDIDFHSRRAGANIGALRRIARWYTVDTLEAIATGDMNRAVDDCLAIFRVADVEVTDDHLLAGLIRISIIAMGTSHLGDTLSRTEFTDAQLARFIEVMRSLEHRFDLAPLIARDLQLQMTFLKYPRFVPIDERYGDLAMRRWQWAFYQKNPTYVPEGITEQTVFGQTREKWIDDALYSTFVTWCPGHLQLKHARAFDNTLALYDELADPAITPQRLIDIASGQDSDDVFFVHTATVGTFQQVRAHTQATIAALEVERFRLREGRWPTGLGEVFDEVPQCAYGHPLHMKRIGHEVRVYSIGENGIDEDGNGPASPHDYEAEDDWGIILLDPDQRGRPATED